jgi:hypothetical protein
MAPKLLPIQVRGRGTAEIESLHSYIHRSAYHHNVFVGVLLKYMDREIKRDSDFPGHIGCLPSYIHHQDILRKNSLSDYLIDSFGYLTCQSLRGTNASFLNAQLNMSRGELSSGFRWCPECMAEMMELGEEPYFKLIWQFRAIQGCPIHRTSLVRACVNCGCTQNSYQRVSHLGKCQQCSSSLRRKPRKNPIRQLTDNATDLIQLVYDWQMFSDQHISPYGVSISLNKLLDSYRLQNKEEDFYRLLSRGRLLSAANRKTKLSLSDARKLSFQLGISLFDLISGNAANTSQRFDLSDSHDFPSSFSHASVRDVKDHKSVLKNLKELSESDVAPMSLKSTAKKLGVSVGYLEYRFPAQVRLIVNRYQSYLDRDHLRKVYLAQTRALQYFLDVSENRAAKSRKHAYKQIREETGLPKWILKKAIQTAYQAMT